MLKKEIHGRLETLCRQVLSTGDNDITFVWETWRVNVVQFIRELNGDLTDYFTETHVLLSKNFRYSGYSKWPLCHFYASHPLGQGFEVLGGFPCLVKGTNQLQVTAHSCL